MKKKMLIENHDKLLNELYGLVLIEQERSLTEEESARYVEIATCLQDNNVEIPFGIVL